MYYVGWHYYRPSLEYSFGVSTQHVRDINPMLVKCSPNVCDVGPPLNQSVQCPVFSQQLITLLDMIDVASACRPMGDHHDGIFQNILCKCQVYNGPFANAVHTGLSCLAPRRVDFPVHTGGVLPHNGHLADLDTYVSVGDHGRTFDDESGSRGSRLYN